MLSRLPRPLIYVISSYNNVPASLCCCADQLGRENASKNLARRHYGGGHRPTKDGRSLSTAAVVLPVSGHRGRGGRLGKGALRTLNVGQLIQFVKCVV